MNDIDLNIDNPRFLKIMEHKDLLFKKYKVIFDNRNISIDDIDISQSWSSDNNINDLVYWFKIIEDGISKKYIIKEELTRLCLTFETDYLETIVPENQVLENQVIDNQLYLDTLINFYRTHINNFPNIFPKLLEETEDFFIFEFIEGRVLHQDDFNRPEIQEQYFSKQKQILDLKLNFRLSNYFDHYWVESNNNIYFVHITKFVLVKNPQIQNPVFEFEREQLYLYHELKKKSNDIKLLFK